MNKKLWKPQYKVLKQTSSKELTLVVGIDEAGRGPVIGPMVIAATSLPESMTYELDDIGVKDSKLLSPSRRKQIFELLLQILYDIIVVEIPPPVIDSWVYKHKYNLLEAKIIAELIDFFDIRHVRAIIIDSPSSPKKFKTQIAKNLRKHDFSSKLVIESKADKNYSIVSAASIIAKVLRDEEIEKIKREINIDFGSGYPSDPKTRASLNHIIKIKPDIVRKSWSTLKELNNAKISDFLKK